MSEQSLPPELGRLSAFVDSNVECLVGPSSELRSISLHATKHIFDWALETERSSKPHLRTLLSTLAESAPPQTRSQARCSPMQKTQRKINIRETPLPSLFIEGMNVDQIWQQLDLRATRVCENLQILLGDEDEQITSLDGEGGESGESDDEDEDEDDAEGMDVDGDDDGDWDDDDNGDDDDDDDENIWEEDGSSTAEDVVVLRDETSEDEDEDEGPPTSMLDVVRAQKPHPSGPYSQEHSGLDDGFFDLATFNAETSVAEAKEVHKRKLTSVADDDPSDESEVDLFASVDDLMVDSVEDGLEPFYNDFFDPPSQARNRNKRSSKVRFHERVSVKKIKAVGKGMPVSLMEEGDSDEEEESDCSGDSSS